MITLIALTTLLANPISEFPERNAQEISLVAIAKLPNLGAKDRQILDVIGKAITRGTEIYGRREAYQITDGRTVTCSVLPDAVILQFSVPANNLKLGISLMDALIHNASLTQIEIDRAVDSLGRKEQDYWHTALSPYKFELGSVTREQVQDLYARVFRPEAVYLGVGGAIKPGEAEDEWSNRIERWHPVPLPQYPDISLDKVAVANSSGITTGEIRGQEMPNGDPAIITKTLALYALGSGKESSLHRIVREKLGLSYRQESILWPTTKGWLPRLIIAMADAEDPAASLDAAKKELLADIETWQEKDLKRAIGMANANLRLGVPLGPLGFLEAYPGRSVEDRVKMGTYWQMKTGTQWSTEKFLNTLEFVQLQDLKDAATAIVRDGTTVVLSGK